MDQRQYRDINVIDVSQPAKEDAIISMMTDLEINRQIIEKNESIIAINENRLEQNAQAENGLKDVKNKKKIYFMVGSNFLQVTKSEAEALIEKDNMHTESYLDSSREKMESAMKDFENVSKNLYKF